MRRLKTLNRDPKARHAVSRANRINQSGDAMDFGLLCYEQGRVSVAVERASHAELLELRRRCAEIPQRLASDDGHWNELHEWVLTVPLRKP